MKKGISNIPYFFQRLPYSCGPACARMAVAFFTGIDFGEPYFVSLLKTTETHGTEQAGFLGLTSHGLAVALHTDSSLESIEQCLENGGLGIVRHLVFDPDPWAHLAIVQAVTERNVLLCDPYYGSELHMTRSSFLEQWNDGGQNEAGIQINRAWISIAAAPLNNNRS